MEWDIVMELINWRELGQRSPCMREFCFLLIYITIRQETLIEQLHEEETIDIVATNTIYIANISVIYYNGNVIRLLHAYSIYIWYKFLLVYIQTCYS